MLTEFEDHKEEKVSIIERVITFGVVICGSFASVAGLISMFN